MAITDVGPVALRGAPVLAARGLTHLGPFAPSHVKAKTSLEKHSELDDVSFVDTYIAQFVQGGAPHPVYQGTLGALVALRRGRQKEAISALERAAIRIADVSRLKYSYHCSLFPTPIRVTVQKSLSG